MDFEIDDLEIDEAGINQARIEQLTKEIAQLRAQLNVPSAIRGSIGGAALGAGLGMGTIGIIAGTILGYNMNKGKDLDEATRERLTMEMAEKARELLKLQRQDEIESTSGSGIMSSRDLKDYKYDLWPFDGKYRALVGQPSKRFHMMVFGRPKAGKSYFCNGLAQYLTRFGRVLYIAAEEGFSATLQKKLQDMGGDNANLDFANFRTFEQVSEAIRSNDYDFVFIDSVNYMKMEPEEIEELKTIKPFALITVQQATKSGQFRGSQTFAHNCDIICEVIDGVVYHTGRFQDHTEMNVFDQKKPKQPVKQTVNLPSENFGQIDLFNEDF